MCIRNTVFPSMQHHSKIHPTPFPTQGIKCFWQLIMSDTDLKLKTVGTMLLKNIDIVKKVQPQNISKCILGWLCKKAIYSMDLLDFSHFMSELLKPIIWKNEHNHISFLSQPRRADRGKKKSENSGSCHSKKFSSDILAKITFKCPASNVKTQCSHPECTVLGPSWGQGNSILNFLALESFIA